MSGVARPFRFQPPSLPQPALPRPRLLGRLAQRWDRRLVTVVAGPGFGKTVLLAAALAENRLKPAGRDLWLSSEPADESGEHLIAGLVEALGLPAGAALDAVIERVWSQTPEPISLIIDDGHEIPAGSPGAAVLGRLLVDLPANGHLVLASRDTVPVPTARLAASGQLVALTEDDLVLDDAELEAFAEVRGVDASLLARSGGWPALAELTANAGTDVVLDYLWEEVLSRIGPERAKFLACLAAAGGGDDEVASALADRPVRIDDVVTGVPLVQRAATGWAALHPLFGPALRRVLTEGEASEARRRAAGVHQRNGRPSLAFDLFAEADAWDDALAVVKDAATKPLLPVSPAELGRWFRALPPKAKATPEALLAKGLERQARAPLDSLVPFEAAARGFRARGDVEAELAAIAQDGIVRWWANDMAGLLALHVRVEELAAAGSTGAPLLRAVGLAAMAHLSGDSERVLSELAGVDDQIASGWLVVVHWLRSVAHRRNGDLQRAYGALDAAAELPAGPPQPQLGIARLRADWLQGRVDHVCAELGGFQASYEESGDRFLATETALERAGKAAWLGQLDAARDLVATADHELPNMPGALARILRLIALAAIAVGEGDETSAGALLRDAVVADLGRPEAWYWRDRAAVALVHVLVPETRTMWPLEPLGPAHLPGLELAHALEPAREGDLSRAGALRWPEPGVVRAHLPLPWVVELAAAGLAARNPPPEELLAAVGPNLRPTLRGVIMRTPNARVVTAAKKLMAQSPVLPAFRLRVAALGPLEVHRDGEVVTHADLRRHRVRELLCYLVAYRRARREAVADELWPDLRDPGRNLRTTLSYLQRVLQPERSDGGPPYFVRAEGGWLVLGGDERLEVDVWELEAHLTTADAAERATAPTDAIAAYSAALPLWRGEPFADIPFAPWAQPYRTNLRARYVAAALRAGELLLSSGATADSRDAATRAIAAEPTSEPAYRLLVRTHLAEDDLAGARHALDDLRRALAELDLEPDAGTVALVTRPRAAVSAAQDRFSVPQ